TGPAGTEAGWWTRPEPWCRVVARCAWRAGWWSPRRAASSSRVTRRWSPPTKHLANYPLRRSFSLLESARSSLSVWSHGWCVGKRSEAVPQPAHTNGGGPKGPPPFVCCKTVRRPSEGRPSEEGVPLPPIGGHGAHVGVGVGVDQVQDVEPFAQFTGFGVTEPHPVTDLQFPGSGTEQRGLYLTGAFVAAEGQLLGKVGRRQPVCVGGSRGRIAAAEHGDDPGCGTADHGKGEHRRRTAPEGPVVVEQVWLVKTGTGRHLGDGAFTSGGVQAAGAPAVDQTDIGH